MARVTREHSETSYNWARRVHASGQARFEELAMAVFRGLIVRGRDVRFRTGYWDHKRWASDEYDGEMSGGLDRIKFQAAWTLVQDKKTGEPRDQIVLRFGSRTGTPGRRGYYNKPSADCVRITEPDGGFDARKIVEAIEAWLATAKENIAARKEREQKQAIVAKAQGELREHMKALGLAFDHVTVVPSGAGLCVGTTIKLQFASVEEARTALEAIARTLGHEIPAPKAPPAPPPADPFAIPHEAE